MSEIFHRIVKPAQVKTTDGGTEVLGPGLYRVHPGDNGVALYPAGHSEPIVIAEGERLRLTKGAILRKGET